MWKLCAAPTNGQKTQSTHVRRVSTMCNRRRNGTLLMAMVPVLDIRFNTERCKSPEVDAELGPREAIQVI